MVFYQTGNYTGVCQACVLLGWQSQGCKLRQTGTTILFNKLSNVGIQNRRDLFRLFRNALGICSTSSYELDIFAGFALNAVVNARRFA
jgi:hypothetical protein